MKSVARPRFLQDVEEAADYLYSEAGERVQLDWTSALKETIKLIEKFPEIGRVRHDLPIPDIRSFCVKAFPNWIVFYRIEARKIELLRVKHGMMHLPALFEQQHGG